MNKFPHGGLILKLLLDNKMDLCVFHQCFKERAATDFAIKEFVYYNGNKNYYLVSDGGPDLSDIAAKYEVNWCHEENITMNTSSGNGLLKLIDRLKKYFTISGCKYLMLMEDDVWCRGKLDYNFEFNALGANSTNNVYEPQILSYIKNKYPITVDNNYFNLCGGSILNRNIFFDHYDTIKSFALNDHDILLSLTKDKYYGFWDSALNLLYMICNKEISINPDAVETWRDPTWRTGQHKIIHWYKSLYEHGKGFESYYL